MEDFLYHYKAFVTRVIDGDTFECELDLGFKIKKSKVRVRLLGVNTPELHSKDAEEKKEAYRAKEFTKQEIDKKEVIIKSNKVDAFGRCLAIVYYKQGDDWINLNSLLLKKRLAKVYK